MEKEPLHYLKSYWGHSAFRPFQEDIIDSVVSGKDVLAILPTGGGKSICFQIPGLISGKVTLVVSPLISLMNDQVDILRVKGIKAIALHSGLSRQETRVELVNIRNGKYQFLYVSPERLKTEEFLHLISRTEIGLLAVDEAHCISQWGHDFRPDYLEIKTLREHLKKIPCIALTASANPHVEKDILNFLGMGTDAPIFRQTVVRENLRYAVITDENKNERMLNAVQRLKGTGIVFVKTRKAAQTLSELLIRAGVSADFYHAGLTFDERRKRQDDWQQGRVRVIVCTNAFGMGIDKSDVRFVIHYDISDSLEAYYQEAGRAGRDGQESWCILLYCIPDRLKAEQLLRSSFLSKEETESVFLALCSRHQLPIEGGLDRTFEFEPEEISRKLGKTQSHVHHAMQILQREGLLFLSEAYSNPSRLKMVCRPGDLHAFYEKNAGSENFLKTILRMYGGLFDHYTVISEFEIARNLKYSVNRVREGLERLHRLKYLEYLPQNEHPVFTLLMPRPARIPYDRKRWEFLQKSALDRLNAMVGYAEGKNCRQQIIAGWFGETNVKACGLCDNCLAEKRKGKSAMETVMGIMDTQVGRKSLTLAEILQLTGETAEVKDALRMLMDSGQLVKTDEGRYLWRKG